MPKPARGEAAPRVPDAAGGRGHERFIPSLQAVRGIAAFFVVVYHAEVFLRDVGASTNLPGVRLGWVGVDLFFVLSAYVLTRALRASRSPRYLDFLVDRLLRVLPAYYVALAATGVALIAFDPSAFRPVPILANVVLVQNLHPAWLTALSSTFWTLAVEVQFYLLLPFLISKHLTRRRLVWLVVFALLMAATVRAIFFAPDAIIHSSMSLPAFGFHFALGVVAAHVGAVARPGIWLAAAVPLLALPPWLGTPPGSTGFEGGSVAEATLVRPLIAVGCLALVLAAASPGRLRRALESPVWLWLGKISFSLYLIHAVVLAKTLRICEWLGLPAAQHPHLYLGLGIGLSLLVGKALYGVVEGPAEAWRRQRKGRERLGLKELDHPKCEQPGRTRAVSWS
ncbi:MAG TPA: acyltransferase [Polyangia bacterium]